MRNLGKSLLALTAALLLFLPAHAQTTAKSAAAKPPVSRSQALLDSWNHIGQKLTAMAEDMPEEKYDFKPNPAQRTFAEQLLHVAGANYYFINPAKGLKPPKGDPKRSDYSTKAQVVAFVRKSYADGAELIKSKGDAGLDDLIANPFSGRQVRVGDDAWGFVEHSGEHYGQLVVYYRVLGMVPPASRPKK